MSVLKQLRYEIGVAQGDGKTPQRWIIRAEALPLIEQEAAESGLTADPGGEADRMVLGLPYDIGQPANGKDVALICAEDGPGA
jgi:hypothetical protein